MGSLIMSVPAVEVFSKQRLKLYNKCVEQYSAILSKFGLDSEVKCYLYGNNPDYFFVNIVDGDMTVKVFNSATLDEFYIKLSLFMDTVDYANKNSLDLYDSCARCAVTRGRFFVIEEDCETLDSMINILEIIKEKQLFSYLENPSSNTIH
jgi:hypothetical protein